MRAEDQIREFEGTERTGIDYTWLASAALVGAVSAFLRFYWLGLKPFHHDEGVNGFFLKTLFTDGVYKYDPANYHGPTLYYISLAFSKLFGLTTISVRMSVAVFGVLTVVLALFLRRYIGKVGALAAALFLALSPGMVYISRYFIHEMFFVFCSLAVVVSVVFFIDKRKAGHCAKVWAVIVLMVVFLPSALRFADILAGESNSALWAFRIAFLIVEGVLIFFVMRMVLSWDSGRPVYLLLASASVAMLFATKETAFITLGTMLIAMFCVWLWRSIANGEAFQSRKAIILGVFHAAVALPAIFLSGRLIEGGKWLYENFLGKDKAEEAFVFYGIVVLIVAVLAAWVVFIRSYLAGGDTALAVSETDLEEPAELSWTTFRTAIGTGTDRILILTAVAVVFIFLNILFFSSFFTYFEGVAKAFEAYAIWTKTGNKDHTQNGILAYIKWGMKVEAPILIVSTLGALIALLKAKHRFAMFTAFWAFGLFAAYTIIPYKTPWLALSFFLPMCIVAGYGLNELITSRRGSLKITGIAVGAIASAILAYQTYSLNFVRYDDEEMAYVYAHTKREFLDMVRKINYYSARSPKGTDSTIEIVSPDYWPLTWYMNDFPHANFHGSFPKDDPNASEMIVAKKNDQDAEVIRRLSAHYKFVDVYPLRPGVDLMLLVRKDIADANAQELYKILEYEDPPGRR